MYSPPTPPAPVFPPTNWTLIAKAALSDAGDGREALAELCRAYWKPLYVFARRHGFEPEDARDVTQEFFLELTERQLLDLTDPGGGRFRTWLLACFTNVLSHSREHRNAVKRGGRAETIMMAPDELERAYAGVCADHETPDRLFDRAWARTLLDKVLERLRKDCGDGTGAARFAVGRSFLPRGGDSRTFAAAAQELGLSEEAMKAYVHRLRRRYGELFREEVQRTLPEGADIKEEMEHLYAALS